jgi:hypothetical protein
VSTEPRSGRMARAAQALLVLYPRGWRDRYGAEMRELLAQHHVSARTMLDLLFGAVDARLHPALLTSRELTVTRKIRTGQFVVSCAAALYALALLALQQIRDPLPAWLRATALHPQLRAGLTGVQVTGALAVFAGAMGLLVMTAAMARRAAGTGMLGRLAGKAAVPAVAWLAVTVITVAVTSGRPGTGARPVRTVDLVLEFTWLASTAIAVLLDAVLAWRVLAGTDLTGTVIRTLRICATVAATAMAAGLIATVIEASMLRAYAPALIGTGWLAFIGVGMIAATVMAGLALPQMTWPTRPRPGSAAHPG